jgi:hypothetical protein
MDLVDMSRDATPSCAQEGVVAINRHSFATTGMDDEHAHHAHRQLHHFVGVRVIHVAAMLFQSEFVRIGFTRPNGGLRQAAHAVHPRRQQNAVPVNGGVFIETIGHQDAHAIAFHGFKGGTRRGAVIAPAFGAATRRELVFDFFCNQMKFLYAAFHLVRQRPAIQGSYRRVVAGCAR